MSYVLHRTLAAELPVAVRGDGPYIIDADGRRYLDASGGAAVSCLGHSHPKVIAAIAEQAGTLAFAHTGFFTTEPFERLAEHLVTRAPEGIARAGLLCGGSEAVEAAIKLARQYWIERGEPSRSIVISRELSYHGNTIGALSVSGNLARRTIYEPYLFDESRFVAPCYPYRHKRDDESDEAYGLRAANQLEAAIFEVGPRRVAAFVAEPVVGATAGCLVPAPGYFARVREICDRHDVLFVADEIMCGVGRTGTLFAVEQEGVTPDIITVAKGLGAGYQPVGAVLASAKVVDAVERGTGSVAHGHTYMGHAVAAAAALAVLRAIEEEDLLSNVRRMGERLERGLRERFGEHPHVGDVRGRGLFWALELVEDRAEKRPFDPSLGVNARVKRTAMRNGMICYPSGGTADGTRGDHVLLAPPYIVDESHVDEIVETLDATLDEVFSDLR